MFLDRICVSRSVYVIVIAFGLAQYNVSQSVLLVVLANQMNLLGQIQSYSCANLGYAVYLGVEIYIQYS